METYHCIQDRKGFLWFTSDAGICRYDGNELKVFTSQDGLPENVVFEIYEDHKGRIWFNTLSGYFFYYYNGQFHSIAANEQLKKICKSLPFGHFFVDENDTLQFTSGKSDVGGVRGIFKIPSQHNFKTIIRDSTSFLYSDRFIKINPKNHEEFLIGQGGMPMYTGLRPFVFSYNEKKLTFHLIYENVYSDNAKKGTVDKYGNFFMTTSWQLDIIAPDATIKGHYDFNSPIASCHIDKDHNLWVCTLSGGYIFENADLHKPCKQFLKGVAVSSVLIDREGTVWAATLEQGVLKSLNKDVLFFNEAKDKPEYLQRSPYQLNIAYASQKVISIFQNDSVSVNNELKSNTNFKSNLISVYLDDQYTYTGLVAGLVVQNTKTKDKLMYDKKALTETLKIGEDSVLCMGSSHLFIFHNKINYHLLPSFPLRFPYQLKNKKIIISSRNNNGIYELKNNQLEPFLSEFPQLKTRINAIIEDVYGNLWFATNERGLYCIDDQKKIHQYTMANNLNSDKINSLAIDEKQNLWCASYNGLTKISYTKDLQKVEMINFNESHGLPILQIDKLISFDGKIVCKSKNSCFYFEEDKLKKNSVPPFTYLQSVFINDRPYSITASPVLAYDQNNLHVFASLITYKDPEQRKFLYKLVGYDKNWHLSASGDIQYPNLTSGNYTLTIYGLNNDTIKSDKPATFTFKIKKPFWFTWWFISLEIVLFFAILFFIFKFWKNKIEKREREKTAANQRVAEFKMTALRSQMNPHFIFNAIGSIQHYILKNEVKQSYNYLSKFSLLIRNILNNSRQEYISLTQEINTLRLYIELEQIRFTHPFQFTIEIDKELDIDMDIPTMLIQPYVENSIWHGLMPKESGGVLELLLKKTDRSLLVTIRDNGAGRKVIDPSKKAHMSKGMSITEQRIQTLEATNEKKFDIVIIDLKDDQGMSSGTEVRITIPFDL